MNADALLLYSYLMRQDIPFTRFCHPAYRDRTQWIQSLKKSKLEPVFPVCRVFVSTTGGFLLMLGTAVRPRAPLPDAGRQHIAAIEAAVLFALFGHFQCADDTGGVFPTVSAGIST